MGKLAGFKARAEKHGQTVQFYAFESWPSGDHVNTYTGEPDPEDEDYPASVPEPTYADVVSLDCFFQPVAATKRDEYVAAPWGEEVRVTARLMVPGDQTMPMLSKVVYGSLTYYVVAVAPWSDGSETIYKDVSLTEKVPLRT